MAESKESKDKKEPGITDIVSAEVAVMEGIQSLATKAQDVRPEVRAAAEKKLRGVLSDAISRIPVYDEQRTAEVRNALQNDPNGENIQRFAKEVLHGYADIAYSQVHTKPENFVNGVPTSRLEQLLEDEDFSKIIGQNAKGKDEDVMRAYNTVKASEALLEVIKSGHELDERTQKMRSQAAADGAAKAGRKFAESQLDKLPKEFRTEAFVSFAERMGSLAVALGYFSEKSITQYAVDKTGENIKFAEENYARQAKAIKPAEEVARGALKVLVTDGDPKNFQTGVHYAVGRIREAA